MYKPTAPVFGYPLMQFDLNPVEKLNNKIGKFEHFHEVDEAMKEIEEFEKDMY